MRYVVHTRQTIRQIDPPEPHLIVSISHEEHKRPKLPRNAQTLAVLNMLFNDVDHHNYQPPVIPFSTQMAREVIEFWQQWRDKAETCYVHCDAGQCRSPAIAAALQRLETGDDEVWFATKRPNRLVYRTILDFAYRRNLNLA